MINFEYNTITHSHELLALIGNVAHDLKTPLQSFRMELDFLKRRLTADYPSLKMNHQSSGDIDDEHPLSSLISLNAATDFMSMAINRSIDFGNDELPFLYRACSLIGNIQYS